MEAQPLFTPLRTPRRGALGRRARRFTAQFQSLFNISTCMDWRVDFLPCKAKIRRHPDGWQGFLTQSGRKIRRQDMRREILNRLLDAAAAFAQQDGAGERSPSLALLRASAAALSAPPDLPPGQLDDCFAGRTQAQAAGSAGYVHIIRLPFPGAVVVDRTGAQCVPLHPIPILAKARADYSRFARRKGKLSTLKIQIRRRR